MNVKLTDVDKYEIKQLVDSGKYYINEIAERFGVCVCTIHRVIKTETTAPSILTKCQQRRDVKTCEDCFRYKECHEGVTREISDAGAIKLLGAIINVSIRDLFIENKMNNAKKPSITTINKWKRDEIESRMFFESKLFKLTNLDLDYLIRECKRKYNIEDKMI